MDNNCEIDEKNFDNLISRAVKNKCYIEVISLIHNYLELHLKNLIIRKLDSVKESKQDLPEKIKILINRGTNFLKYLNDYNEIAFLLSCINKEGYEGIKRFNKKRNEIVHSLLMKKKKYSEIKIIAKEGRILQLIFNPSKFTEKEFLERMQKEWK